MVVQVVFGWLGPGAAQQAAYPRSTGRAGAAAAGAGGGGRAADGRRAASGGK
ncbi:MAG: hypothetical protein LBD51_02915 [Bifidobacteriaceae bacterium]|nr:hypothetical protein [Bifidobacteriaceae bacterium]